MDSVWRAGREPGAANEGDHVGELGTAIVFRPRRVLLCFWLVGALLACCALGIGAMTLARELGLHPAVLFLLGWLPAGAIASAWLTLYFHSIRYHLDDRYITKDSGVLWKKRRSVPLGKITNLDVRQGPVERLLGYGKLYIFTPSTGSNIPEEKLVGVTDPHRVKQDIIIRSRNDQSARSTAAPQPGAAPESTIEVLKDIRTSLTRIEELLAERGSP